MFRKLFFLWGPVIVWMFIIFLFSSRTRVSLSDSYSINFAVFKFFHIVEYGFLFVLLRRGFKYTFQIEEYDLFVTTLFAVLLYAFSDEIHQTFVPTREGAFRDVIIDGVGATISWIFLLTIMPRLPGKLKNWVKNWQFM